ncbi:hypothetical protein [Xylocopilactobacillus apicola]|uniref:Uncharacterized protein n=1 Tax=Xylocopilactobacillus apicola TaxID=2932184 RepID=A0AAU9DUT9_9LACO|nr:hypothetical protein [Xylocopilactobacillus apicola]BDR57633.1 hypothetical protein XA3_00740 [Xylocopilactobacillus apicola]
MKKEYKRELLYRRGQVKIHQDRYFNKIQTFTNEAVKTDRFLSLEDTDLIIEKIKHKPILANVEENTSDYKEVANFIRTKVNSQPYYLLIDEEWKFFGAYRVLNDLSDKYNFDELVSDEIRIIPDDLTFHIQIDYDFDEITYEYKEWNK